MTEKKETDLVHAGPSRFEIADQIAVTGEGVQISSLAQMKVWAGEVAMSGMAPKGLDTESKVMLAAQTGMELGFSIMRSLQAVVVVNGRATLMGEAALGLIRSSGLLEPGTDIEVGCRATTAAEKLAGEKDWIGFCRTQRAGLQQNETTFSEGDARKAGLWSNAGPWTKYPKRMLGWRSVGFHMRDYWSDVGNGLMLADEARDIPSARPPARDVTPAGSVVTGECDPLIQGLRGDPMEPDASEEADWVEGEFVGATRSVTRDELAEEFPEPAEVQAIPPRENERPEWVNAAGEEIDPETGEVIPDDIGS